MTTSGIRGAGFHSPRRLPAPGPFDRAIRASLLLAALLGAPGCFMPWQQCTDGGPMKDYPWKSLRPRSSGFGEPIPRVTPDVAAPLAGAFVIAALVDRLQERYLPCSGKSCFGCRRYRNRQSFHESARCQCSAICPCWTGGRTRPLDPDATSARLERAAEAEAARTAAVVLGRRLREALADVERRLAVAQAEGDAQAVRELEGRQAAVQENLSRLVVPDRTAPVGSGTPTSGADSAPGR